MLGLLGLLGLLDLLDLWSILGDRLLNPSLLCLFWLLLHRAICQVGILGGISSIKLHAITLYRIIVSGAMVLWSLADIIHNPIGIGEALNSRV